MPLFISDIKLPLTAPGRMQPVGQRPASLCRLGGKAAPNRE